MASLILASSSPRRALLLSAAGFTFDVRIPDVDEHQQDSESAAEMVLRLASDKAEAVNALSTEVVLAADTVVVRDGAIIGKPTDEGDAVAILSRLSGRQHQVLTGWSVRRGSDERFGVSESSVRFNVRTEDELRDYVRRTEPFDKAGAYALQGDDGWLVESISGSRANVMGLPLGDVAEALSAFGIERSTPDRD